MRYLTLLLALLLCGTALAQTPDTRDGTATAPAVAPAPEGTPAVVAAPAAAAPVVVTPVVATGAVTPAVPTSDEAAGMVAGQMLDAVKNGHWLAFGGFLLLMLIWLFNRLGLAAKLGSKAVPWVTLALGVVLSVAVGLIQGTALLDMVKLGLFEGGIAIALWELLFKHFLTKTPVI